jgi:flagellar assembly protein FliH
MTQPARTPKFLTHIVQQGKAVQPAPFAKFGEAAPAFVPEPAPAPVAPPPPPPAPEPQNSALDEAREALRAAEEAALVARLNVSLEKLRMQGEWLAEQARSDALEIGFQVARRILEMEVSVNAQPLFSLVRSAVRRAGESRKLSIRLCPQDVARIHDAALMPEVEALSMAKIELIPSIDLSPGDVVVEADYGTVDGRLATRIEEMRRAIGESMEGTAA